MQEQKKEQEKKSENETKCTFTFFKFYTDNQNKIKKHKTTTNTITDIIVDEHGQRQEVVERVNNDDLIEKGISLKECLERGVIPSAEKQGRYITTETPQTLGELQANIEAYNQHIDAMYSASVTDNSRVQTKQEVNTTDDDDERKGDNK